MKESLQNKYNEFKGVLDVLPVNTKSNQKKKLSYILQEESNTKELFDEVQSEINDRLSVFNNLKMNPNISKLEEEFKKCNIINEWNDYNTSYEKMHLDYYLYQLHRYYKEDLTSVNNCIKKMIDSFKKVDIVLSKEDFDFNDNIALYMDKVINNASDDELKQLFEEIYWKFPEIIKALEVNFKSIYLKNEKKINKYYEDRHKEFLLSHKDDELTDVRINLFNKINDLKNKDQFLIFEKFKNKEYSLASFNKNDVEKKINTYFDEESYNYDNLNKVYQTLFEYNMLIKYHYLLVDMRERLEKKDTFKDLKQKELKEILAHEVKIKKLTVKPKSKFSLFKKKTDEKWLFNYNTLLNSIIEKYDKFDDSSLNDIIFHKLSLDSTVLEVLKFVSSNYLYYVKLTKQLDDNLTINDITDRYEELKNDVNNNRFNLLNNIALLDEKQMKQIIVDKYNLEHINLTIESLEPDNVEKTMNDIKNLINYEDLLASKINLDDVKLYFDINK